jgi:outer membrane receptor for Fe3+-dicitrate
MINCKAFGTKRSWYKRNTVMQFEWKNWGKLRNTFQDSRYPGRDSKRALPWYKSKALSPEQSVRLPWFYIVNYFHVLRVSARYITDFVLFGVNSSGNNCPSARCAQQLELPVGTLIYLEPKLFLLIILYNGAFVIIKMLIVFNGGMR